MVDFLQCYALLLQAGIEDGLLSLAYEPEAAAIYCKDITLQKKVDGPVGSLETFDSGHQFLVLDCGGQYLCPLPHGIQYISLVFYFIISIL